MTVLVDPFGVFGGGGASLTWNPSDIGPGVALSNGDKTATGSTGVGSAHSGVSKNSGKWYFEAVLGGSVTTTDYIGVDRAGNLVSHNYILNANSFGVEPSGNVATSGSIVDSFTPHFGVGDVVGIAFDIGASRLYVSVNGVYVIPASTGVRQDPVTGVSGFLGVATPSVPSGFPNLGNSWTLGTGSPPSGYSIWI